MLQRCVLFLALFGKVYKLWGAYMWLMNDQNASELVELAESIAELTGADVQVSDFEWEKIRHLGKKMSNYSEEEADALSAVSTTELRKLYKREIEGEEVNILRGSEYVDELFHAFRRSHISKV